MPDEHAIWNKDLEDSLEKQGMYPNREARSNDEEVQNIMLTLENQLELIRNDFQKHNLTNQQLQEIFDSIQNIQAEITKIKEISPREDYSFGSAGAFS